MSDRLKFRVWDKYFERYWTDEQVKNNIQWLLYPDNENIENVIIEQCTGLRDKNGKLIYEGDIVSKAGLIREVIRKNEYFTFKDKNGEICIFEEYVSEVIGNIHENPEWLNADKA